MPELEQEVRKLEQMIEAAWALHDTEWTWMNQDEALRRQFFAAMGHAGFREPREERMRLLRILCKNDNISSANEMPTSIASAIIEYLKRPRSPDVFRGLLDGSLTMWAGDAQADAQPALGLDELVAKGAITKGALDMLREPIPLSGGDLLNGPDRDFRVESDAIPSGLLNCGKFHTESEQGDRTMTEKQEPYVASLDLTTIMQFLAEPFAPELVQWKPQATNKDKTKALAAPYASARVYEDRLNEVCPADWSVTFLPWGDAQIICALTIAGVLRSSTGEADPSDTNTGTSAEAQAFKRACVKFKLGRYLYDLPKQWVAVEQKGRSVVFTGAALTQLRNSLTGRVAGSRPTSNVQAALMSQEQRDSITRMLSQLSYGPNEVEKAGFPPLDKLTSRQASTLLKRLEAKAEKVKARDG